MSKLMNDEPAFKTHLSILLRKFTINNSLTS